ncbi:MAG TPA: tRNA (guanosine(46)-N7)-methyltransferase TrmB, partial [SAR324 cluster bacterium]|nr:tRNA (guanosine(46)-N7)-methyltransferase TrmB [SAR324 cluster bacterium]
MTDIRYRPSDYRLLPKSNLDRMERNNPYITKIYDYEDWLLPHPDREGFDRKWQRKVQNSSKAHVEIGCGSGRYLMEMARNKPEDTFLGLELRLKRLVLAAKKIKREQLENILLMRERGEYLDDYFETGSIDVI